MSLTRVVTVGGAPFLPKDAGSVVLRPSESLVAFFLVAIMSTLLLQFIIVAEFGALCFGCGYLTAFIVTRNQWRDEMIERGVAHYHWQTGKWDWGKPPKEPTTWKVQ
jgi:hypothetical protein